MIQVQPSADGARIRFDVVDAVPVGATPIEHVVSAHDGIIRF